LQFAIGVGVKKICIEVDTHSHSVASHHALSTIEEMLRAANAKGIRGLVLSDHHPSLRFEGDDYFINAPDEAFFHVFCQRFKPQDSYGIKLFKSIELNILDHDPWVSPLSDRFDNLFDLKIAGIHSFPHLFSVTSDICFNTELVVNAIRSGEKRKFDIFTHPVALHFPLDIKLVVEECVERGIALEVNNSNLLYKKEIAPLVKSMLKEVVRCGGHIAVGSDAHMASEVGRFSEAIKILEDVAFPSELIVNSSLGRFISFISEY
jgi:putative hydrolase